MCWRPLPMRPPRPDRKSSRSGWSGAARRSITGAVRSTQTRDPAATAGSAAACHSRVTSVSSAWPRVSAASVSTAEPWSP